MRPPERFKRAGLSIGVGENFCVNPVESLRELYGVNGAVVDMNMSLIYTPCMELNRDQIQLIAKTFTDLAKILFAAAVIGFFIPGYAGIVNVPTFITGAISSASLFIVSVGILR